MLRNVTPNSPGASARGDARPDLILGIINNYTFYEVSRFVLTLKRSGYRGHVCLFAGPNIGRVTIARLRRHGIEVIRYRERFPFLDSPNPASPSWLPAPIHIWNYRHFLYHDYLLNNPGRFRNVLLSDVKDVVFQRDPFDFAIGDRLYVAMENAAIPIGECPWTGDWIVAAFGTSALEQLGPEAMSCAGTTLGPAERITAYLRAMLAQIQQMRDAYAGADQAAHNRLLHEGALDPVEKLANFEGPILTVGSEPAWTVNASGELINNDGSVIHIVHQYHWHPKLVRLADALARPRRSQRIAARLAFVAADEVRRGAPRLRSRLTLLFGKPPNARATALRPESRGRQPAPVSKES